MDKKVLLGESKYVEYKRSYTRTLLETVSAFANYHDGHTLIGLGDDGELVGVSEVEELRLSIENAINDSIEPKPYYELETETIDAKYLVILQVYKGEHTPYEMNDKVYKRMDISTVQVDRLAHSELILAGRNQSFETLKAVGDSFTFHALSAKLKQVLSIKETTEDLLKTLGLLDSKGYNNAAMLFDDNSPLESSRIDLIAYKDHTVRQIKDRRERSHMSVIDQ